MILSSMQLNFSRRMYPYGDAILTLYYAIQSAISMINQIVKKNIPKVTYIATTPITAPVPAMYRSVGGIEYQSLDPKRVITQVAIARKMKRIPNTMPPAPPAPNRQYSARTIL